MVNISTTEMVPGAGEFKPGAEGTALLVIDVQEKLAPAIPGALEVVARIAALIELAKTAGLPILASEQYSRGLGQTLPALRTRLGAADVIEKIHFAAPREPAFTQALEARGITRLCVAGMEAHVCVLQTVLALLARGVAVTVIADAVASRDELNRRVALARLARAGAVLSDSAAFGVEPASLSP